MIIQRRLRNGDWRHVHTGNRLDIEVLADRQIAVVEYGIDEKTGDPTAIRLVLNGAELTQLANARQKFAGWTNRAPETV